MLYPVELRAPYDVEYPRMAQDNGRGREIRTPDILLPKQARYQTALYPDIFFCQRIDRRQRAAIILSCFCAVKRCWYVFALYS